MAKEFAPRVSKRERDSIDLAQKVGQEIFNLSDDKLLRGAKLTEIKLKDITVKAQVRTKFNDDSIKELAANIKANGLIQPLVLNKEGDKHILICGERRFRAMSSINMEKAPCFVLDNKSKEELMAIQFSENSSREALHYIDKADGIYNYQKATKSSERKIVEALGISKTEVHRSLIIAKLPKNIKESAKVYDIEKYVLIEFAAIPNNNLKKEILNKINAGEITKRAQLKKALKSGSAEVLPKSKTTKKNAISADVSANAFIKAMNAKSKDMNIDKETQKILKSLMDESRELVDGV
ncbi:MAG: ParB/RepB/Spo0J family partition protein [Halobacteriovoraceae bacterium]|nr:ParB/RepB/Spo0J family partition protein [Halobacteriovoraceae bacterium]